MTAEILAATEHLVLRRMTNDAAAALAAYRSDPVQARYQSWETPYGARRNLLSRRRQRPTGPTRTSWRTISSPKRLAAGR